MANFVARPLLVTNMVTVWDVISLGAQRHKRRGARQRDARRVPISRRLRARREETVAEANQVVFLNADEHYRISRPLNGAASSSSIWIEPAALLELAPDDDLLVNDRPVFNQPHVRIERARSLCTENDYSQRLPAGS